MTKITIAVPEDVYRQARMRAAERGSSVGDLVATYLRSLADRGAEFVQLEAQQHEVQQAIERFRADDNLCRDALHDRAAR